MVHLETVGGVANSVDQMFKPDCLKTQDKYGDVCHTNGKGVFVAFVWCYRVIVLVFVNIVPSWDIETREPANVRRYPNKGQYSPISVQ